MSDEEKNQRLVDPHHVAAASFASIVAAFLTSKLGVTGTLIGAGVTSMMSPWSRRS